MVISENWKEELDLYHWKMMQLEQCIEYESFEGTYRYGFPNGIRVTSNTTNQEGKYCFFWIKAHVENSVAITNRLGSIQYKRTKLRGAKESDLRLDGHCPTKGVLLELLWNIYSIGSD